MESSLPKSRHHHLGLISFALFLLLVNLLLLPPFGSAHQPHDNISYHNGPLLTGNVSLAVLWYGQFDPVEKTVVRAFIGSLSLDRSLSFQPDVSSWWEKVESYLAVAKKNSGKRHHHAAGGGVRVRIGKEVDDEKASVGRVLSSEYLPGLLQKATAGLPNTVAVIFTAKDVTVPDTCKPTSTCYLHGVIGKQVYMVVGNPKDNCPGVCAVPFHRSDIHVGPPLPFTLLPPSGNVGADALIVQFASALAETVTNPFNTGFFGGGGGIRGKYQAAARACVGLFAKGAFPGYPGNVRVDPNTGGAFNVHGLNSTTFLLPALWDLKTSSCWTVL